MQKTSLKVVFFGNEKLATGIDDAAPIIREAVQAAGLTIERVVTGKLSELGQHDAQLAVLAAYGRIIPESVLNQFPLGIINVHPSLLPLYRGPTPIEQAILDGATKTGVSIMRLTAGMDEGPLYKQKSLILKGNETKADLAKQLQQLGADLIKEVLPQIANGSLKPRQQPHPGRASYSRLLTKKDGVINWHKSAEQLEREVRAFAGWPGSRTTLAGKEVIITQAHASPRPAPKDLAIRTSRHFLVIERLKPAGSKDMSAREFLAGHKLVA